MYIDELIDELNRIKKREGNIQVTCTGTVLPDSPENMPLPDVFETTVETLLVRRGGMLGTRVRLYL